MWWICGLLLRFVTSFNPHWCVRDRCGKISSGVSHYNWNIRSSRFSRWAPAWVMTNGSMPAHVHHFYMAYIQPSKDGNRLFQIQAGRKATTQSWLAFISGRIWSRTWATLGPNWISIRYDSCIWAIFPALNYTWYKNWQPIIHFGLLPELTLLCEVSAISIQSWVKLM